MSDYSFNPCKPCYGCRIDDKTGDVYVDNYTFARDYVWYELNKVIQNAQRNYKHAHPNDYLQLGRPFAVGLVSSLKREAIKSPGDSQMYRALLLVLTRGSTRGYYTGQVDPTYDVNKRLALH